VRPRLLPLFLITSLAFAVVAISPTSAAAQRRGRPAPRRLIVRTGVYGVPFFNPWYSYGYGFGYPYGYQWGYPYPPYGYLRFDDFTASIRLEVTPTAAEVYIDGFRAGTVDDFDGVFQRLHLRPGRHELVLYLDGYRAVHQNLYVNARADQKIRYTMVPLPPGEQVEPRPQPPEVPPESIAPPEPPSREGRGPTGRRGMPMRPGLSDNSQYGSIAIRVQPPDADVLIDGEPWSAPGDQERLVVELPAGRHHIEIRKDGFNTYTSDVDVRSGQAAPLNVSLRKEP